MRASIDFTAPNFGDLKIDRPEFGGIGSYMPRISRTLKIVRSEFRGFENCAPRRALDETRRDWGH
jgi:hypothetical protein